MRVGVGYSDHPDSISAGRQAAQMAAAKAANAEPCDLTLLFATARHNQQMLKDAVESVVGGSCLILGGGAAGVITNDYFGYAGDQVGVACIWLEKSSCTALSEVGLDQSEAQAGERLGKKLLQAGIKESNAVFLLYDAICRADGGMRLLTATGLLNGIENGMGFLPKLMGAGLQGDHACSATMQYTADGRMQPHSAIALAFSEDILIDHIVMHGCRPASPYYTVTKADGSVILEINGKNAISFIDEILEGAIAPEEYPFFLLFGLNHGEAWGEYDEGNYASRLCLDIDKERGGIVMFEPDMVEGMQFQIMFRSLDLDYMKPKIDKMFSRLNGREPVFALYIDCAGRCAGYGGIDIEDALVIQSAVGTEVPLLGIYTGAEIAPMGGHSRGLDLTGVFCLFSKRNDTHDASQSERIQPTWRKTPLNAPEKQAAPLEGVTRLCERNAAKVLALDSKSIAMRHELEQKRRGFSLLAEFTALLCEDSNNEDIFFPATQRINSALNMQKTAVLFPNASGKFVPYVLQGYSVEEKGVLAGMPITIDEELLMPDRPVLVTAEDSETRLKALRDILKLPYFISTPIVVKNEVAAILITGRLVEASPFLCRLNRSDVETVQAISGLLSSSLVYRKLDDANRQAQTDALTGLLNRGALELRVTQLLQTELAKKKRFAFLIIDCDYFKEINDSYGHMTGDTVLSSLADFLQKSFRSNDCVSRIGGDEFAIFCELTDHGNRVLERAAYLVSEWNKQKHIAVSGDEISSSISIGIAFAPRDGSAYDELFHRADMALYRSKQLGRNLYTVYNSNTMGTLPQP